MLSEDLALNDAVISKGSMARVAEMEVRADGVLVTNLMGGWGHRLHPHRFHRLLHVSGRAYRGAHLTGHHRHSCVRPPAVHPVHGAGAGAAGHRPAPPGSRKHLYLAVDGGKALRITGTERVEISCARQSTRLIRLTERNFYQIIYQKLGGYEL